VRRLYSVRISQYDTREYNMSTDASTLRLQAASLATAASYGAPITVADFNLVEATLDLPVAEVAEALGRTYWATGTIRRLIREGAVSRPRANVSVQAYRGWVEGMGDE